MKYLIVTEKPSAAKNFVKALGGQTGQFSGNDYRIVNLHGHMMGFKEPEEMVSEEKQTAYKSWTLKYLPWQLDEMNWQRTYLKQRQPRTGRLKSTKTELTELQQESKNNYDALVIATDTDPSGEGDLLAWEVIDAIRWHGRVLRANFVDEAPNSIQKSMENLTDVSDKWQHGAYLKGETRSRWDFASMQLTRIATTSAKKAGYKVVAREGRLKSVIVWKIFEQMQAIKNYVKKPYYEVCFTDASNHIYRRQAPKNTSPEWRYDDEAQAKQELQRYATADVTNEQHEKRQQAPDKLLDLAGLAAILAPRGFDSKEVLQTYQKMYEAQIVSYPRTDDKTVTPEQFFELLPKVDQIADVVGVDKLLLTHRQVRTTHVKETGSHGANRPGTKVPANLAALSKYGPSAAAIYEILAKNYLAMLAENYIYDHVTAQLAQYPAFKTAFNIPIALNYKLVYDAQKALQVDEEDTHTPNTQVGPQATPFIFEGVNKKPTYPTTKWLMAFLEKHNVGTGATRVSTLSQMSQGVKAMMQEKKGRLTLTETGNVSAVMVQNTWIASPKITKRLFEIMNEVGEFKISMPQALNSLTQVVAHDMPIMVENAQKLETILGKPKVKKTTSKAKTTEKVSGIFNNQTIQFSKTWSDHTFSDVEVQTLLSGGEVSFLSKTKRGKQYTATGKLAKQTFKGHSYYGFKLNPKS
ncbi:DNA topoisomerase [Weissella sagaensis]|uniref:DNA topoisomerase n=1 Tax=Weissella sagaensis TaxID=2559928 RepID=UPI00123970C3|nr:DNA topoisomerase [Weissella sagaensis]KAA8435057.1 type IA DNA topoisomerase [Weissella paramesenteroides]KAA8438948.1 type IA DNA topoisomerase [Weissella paramesenteroides]